MLLAAKLCELWSLFGSHTQGSGQGQGIVNPILMKYRTRKLIESAVDMVCIALLLLLLSYVVVSMRRVDVGFVSFGVMCTEAKLQEAVSFC